LVGLSSCSRDEGAYRPSYVPEAERLFWTQQWGVYSCNLEGRDIQIMYNDRLACSHAIAVDGRNGKIYWGEDYRAGPNLRRSDLNGRNIENFLMASISPEGIVLDVDADKIYWTDQETDMIHGANLDGSNIVDIFDAHFESLSGIAMDYGTGKIYWADAYGGLICCGSKDGGPIDTLLSGLNSPRAIALDTAGGKMYWTGTWSSLLMWANLDGSSPDTLLSGVAPLGGIAIDLNLGKLYWSKTRTGDVLHRSNLDGTNREVVASGKQLIRGLSIDATTGILYWTCAPREGIGRTDPKHHDLTLLLSEAQEPEGVALDLNNYMVYWVDSWTGVIHRSDIYGQEVEILVKDLSWPHDIVLDTKHNKMYWTDREARIQRANLNGSAIETVLDGTASGLRPRSLALGVTGKRIFWLDEVTPAVYVSPLEGGNQTQLCALTGPPGEISLDLLNNRMYWTAGSSIYRANLDGSSSEVVLTLTEPVGLALDIANGHIYWVDYEVGKLQRANLDGSNITDILEVIYMPKSLAIELE
jgi:DNA-binding beta-propeller fold protein YncE